jgi:hypothetical protein
MTAEGAYSGKISVKKMSPQQTISDIDYDSGNFEEFLDRRIPADHSVLVRVHMKPHRKYDYGSGVRNWSKKPGDIDRVPVSWPDMNIVRMIMLDYASR